MKQQSTLGSYIRSLRTQNEMTQEQLAAKLHVTGKAVSKWERDLSYPDIALFPKLADVLGVNVNDLLNESLEEGQPSRLVQIFEMSHDFRTPLHIILGCAEMAANHYEDKELVMRYLQSIRISGEYLLGTINKAMQTTHQDEADQPDADKIDRDALEACLEGQADVRPGFFQNHDFSGKRILVAEDMKINREIAGEFIRETGAEAEFAEDGEACLRMVESAPAGYYDLILMDVMMPNMDGIEATKRIRQLPDRKKAEIPIIAVSANVYEKDRTAALEAGMDAFTEKPIFVEKLFEVMKQHLKE